MQSAVFVCTVLLLCACGGTTDITGHRDSATDSVVDTSIDPVIDPVIDPEVDPYIDPPVDGCCPAPLVLDPTRGICVDPTAADQSCDGRFDVCEFGQICSMEWGIAPLGEFCHLPCGPQDDYLCPDGWVCSPAQLFDIPDKGCIPDLCEPPMAYHPGTFDCVSTQGLVMDCSIVESCNPGQECVAWLGAEGVDRLTCEIPCAGNPQLCPNGHHCVDIVDGPDDVCRPLVGEIGCDDPWAMTCGHPEKFLAVHRESVCPGCYGAILCVRADPEALGKLASIDPAGAIECEGPVPGGDMCTDDSIACVMTFRSGIDDCPDMMPADWWWTTICAAAHLPEVHSVHCYWLE